MFKRNFTKFFAIKPIALAALLASSAVNAEYMLSTPWYGNADMTPYASNYVEIGIGHTSTSGSSYRANEWGGMKNDAFGIGRFNYFVRKDDGLNFNIWGRNLGLESRKLGASGGQQGKWKLDAEFNQIMHRNTNDGFYIFNGLGSGFLSLPPGFKGLTTNNGQPPNNALNILTNSSYGYGVKTNRQILKLGGEFAINPTWGVTANYRYDKRNGSSLIGAVMGSSGGNPRSAIVPYPINDNTHQVNLGVNFANDKAQVNVAYYFSKYSNSEDSLTWQNPFRHSQWATGAAFPTGFGRLGLAPDNYFHQFKVDGGYNVTPKSRVSAAVQYGMSRQNQTFLPYTINPKLASSPLPALSLDGKINNTLFDLAFNTREIKKLNIKLKYQYKEDKNKTPQNWYAYVGGDSSLQPKVPFGVDPDTINSSFVRYNPISNLKKQTFLVDVDYQILRRNSLRGWYQYVVADMTPKENETRTQTRNNQFGLEWRARALENVTGKLQFTRDQRRGSDDYDQSKPYRASYTAASSKNGIDNNPALRQFHIADYKQDKLKASLDVMPTDQVTIELSADWAKRDYKGPNCGGYRDQIIPKSFLPNQCLGLAGTDRQSYTIDVQYTPSSNLNIYGFYTYAQYKNDQLSRQQNSNVTIVDMRRNWRQQTKNTDDTIGFGVNWKPKARPFEVGAQYLFNDGKGTIITSTAGAIRSGLLPDTKYRLHNANLYLKWRHSKKLAFRADYMYQNMKATDFAYDNVLQWSTNNVIPTGSGSGRYVQHIFGMSLIYSF